jgi:hypothetical protein
LVNVKAVDEKAERRGVRSEEEESVERRVEVIWNMEPGTWNFEQGLTSLSHEMIRESSNLYFRCADGGRESGDNRCPHCSFNKALI